MKAYYSFFKMRLLKGLQYRTAALAGVFTQFFWGFILIMVFEAFYRSTSSPQPISLQELIQVIWLQQSFLVFVMLWFRDSELFSLITSGNIAYELCRPTSLYGFWYARLIAQRLSGAILRSLPIILVASLLPNPYGFSSPVSLFSFGLFFVALTLGLILIVAISMLIYIFTFYTMSPTGSLLIFGVLGEFFGGLILPVPLMPPLLKSIVYILPFRYVADLPFRIYAGNIGIHEGLQGIGIQLLWIFVLLSLGNLWMKNALKKVIIQGG
ncbi:ABC transporter permease [Alkaliphilus hydrothermalis]|uniref:ABC-2 type transport system permease protein n=1 Tax=Alkaliphilus hydrothermalis TaxID=1482730 RepID=A0ABS2NR82_9FIRM|nr:ABC transporter permease [Alkaliphilus hydrothermalis]MBM7615448.1 ABC-2 type transport system permease protein [Alkaliphilus hydrothermalis]